MLMSVAVRVFVLVRTLVHHAAKAAVFWLALLGVPFVAAGTIPAFYEPFCFAIGGAPGMRTYLLLGGALWVSSVTAYLVARFTGTQQALTVEQNRERLFLLGKAQNRTRRSK